MKESTKFISIHKLLVEFGCSVVAIVGMLSTTVVGGALLGVISSLTKKETE